MPPWFAALDGYAILASANFGYAQDDTLSYRFVAMPWRRPTALRGNRPLGARYSVRRAVGKRLS